MIMRLYRWVHYDSANDRWLAWSKDGRQYVFGNTSAARAGYPAQYGCDPTEHPYVVEKTWRWGLSSITNEFGQSLNFTYLRDLQRHELTKCGTFTGEYTTTIWLYPASISYPAGDYQVLFDLTGRDDYLDSWTNPKQYNFYQRYRLAQVRILGGGAVLRRYNFTYYNSQTALLLPGAIWRTLTTGEHFYTLALNGVQEIGRDGALLPATTFDYDALHLTSAANGYGGSAVFAYDAVPWYAEAASLAPETAREDQDLTHTKSGCSPQHNGVYPPPT